ncbi:MAG TPA: tetratricopeptide repeat protein, partial [Candidatus Sumerlaeota bacterium]|nr:tetratricopeptide repeat protein [Candidatus Sumerlaeota bacterium]
MAKKKPFTKPPKSFDDETARPASPSYRDMELAASANVRRAPAATPASGPQTEAPPVVNLQGALDHTYQVCQSAIEWLTIPRLLLGGGTLFALLLVALLVLQSDTINKVRGDFAYDAGQWEQAAVLYAPYLKNFDKNLCPDMAEACLKSARSHLEMKQYPDALDALALAEKSEHRAKYSDTPRLKPDRFAYTGWALMETNDTSRALSNLNQAVAADPAHPLANYLLGQYYEKQGALAQAIPYFDRLVGLPQYQEVCDGFRKRFDNIAALVPADELQGVPEKIEVQPKTSVPAKMVPSKAKGPIPAKPVNIPPALGGPIPAEVQQAITPPQKAPVPAVPKPAAPKAVAPVSAPAPVAPAAPEAAPAPVAPAGK